LFFATARIFPYGVLLEIKGFINSFVDYPGNICVTLFTGGCNYRCPFCHNADLVLSPDGFEAIPLEQVLMEIKQRKKMIDGVVITGGEPLINKDIETLIAPIRDMGLKVKLDTNGSFPKELKALLDSGMLDYVALDIKSSPGKYSVACGVDVDVDKVRESAEMLRTGKIDYELRTTAVPGLVEREDVISIGEWLNGAKSYYLQQFVPDNSLSEDYRKKIPHSQDKIKEFARLAMRYFLKVGVRGI